MLYDHGSHKGEQVCEEDYVLITAHTGEPYMFIRASELLGDSGYVEFLELEGFRFEKSSKEEIKNAYIAKIEEADKKIEEQRKKIAELEELASEFHLNLEELAKNYTL